MRHSFFGERPSRAWVPITKIRPYGDAEMHAWAATYIEQSTRPVLNYESALAMAERATDFFTVGGNSASASAARPRGRKRAHATAPDVQLPAAPPAKRSRAGLGGKAAAAGRAGHRATGVCRFCEDGNANIVCHGPCVRPFHFDCLGIIADPGPAFKCDRCSTGLATCALCAGTAAYVPWTGMG